MEYELYTDIVIDNMEEAEKHFFSLTGVTPDWEKVKDFISSNKENALIYLDSKLRAHDTEQMDTGILWTDTGYASKTGETIFLSFRRRSTRFEGHLVGTGKSFYRMMKLSSNVTQKRMNFFRLMEKYNPQRRVERIRVSEEASADLPYLEENTIQPQEGEILTEIPEEVPSPKKEKEKEYTVVTKQIYDSLLFPRWNSTDGLDNFIKVVGKRAEQLIAQNHEEYYHINVLQDIVVNTGLMDTYGNDFYIMYRKNFTEGIYFAYQWMQSKTMYIEARFTREQAMKELKPITFFDDGEEVLDMTIEDFDITKNCLRHIIEERRERLPEAFRGMSDSALAGSIMQQLEQGVKLQMRDHSYARPIYTNGKISWLFPLDLGNREADVPKLVMAVRKVNEFYQLKTILPLDDHVKDKITACSLYRNVW